MPNDEKDDPMEELITLSQASQEFKIKRSTLNNWVWRGKIPARKEFGELGIEYYLVKRGDVSQKLNSLPDNVRKPRRTT